jgi:predicted dehydrogenase
MSNISRRDILRGSAATALGAALGAKALGQTNWAETLLSAPVSSGFSPLTADGVTTRPVKGRIRFGIIGCGGKGWSGMAQAAENGDIVALADVDAKNRTKAMMEHPRATAFDDYREMLEAMRGKIDAVVISIPDHHHATASALAMHMGLHTYCEKPLCRTIWEARQIARIAKEAGVASQMGNQSTASTAMRKTAALIKSGVFGHAKEVYLWTDRAKGWWPQGVERPATAPTPKELDFEMWLGPRPSRPYAEGYHPFTWRGFWDFGTGSLGDMGCHIFNMPYMALDLRDPISVQAATSHHNKETFPEWAIVHYEFGELNGRPPVKLTWHDGGKRPDPGLCPGFEYGGNGSIVVCEKATIYSPDESNTKFMLVGGGEMKDIQVDESPGHMEEFARAAKGGKPAVSNFPGYSGKLAETVLLGNLAIWADGPRLEWDAKKMEVKGSHEFDSLIKPQFRSGFSV